MKTDFQVAKKSSLLPLLGAALLLGGCAAPIKSRPYVSGESYEGLRYHLSKTTVTVTFAAQLKSCTEGANKNQPSILLLAPTVTSKVSADESSSYIVNPTDSVNWFRKIEVPKLKLSADGRLAEAEAKSVDSTPAVLLNLAQVAFASRKAFMASATAPRALTLNKGLTFETEIAPLPTLLAATCSKQAKQQLDEFIAARAAYDALRKLPRTLTTAKDFGPSATERFKAIQDEEQRLLAQLTELSAALTVRAEVSLSSEADKPVVELLDLAEKWVEETNYYGCNTLDVADARRHVAKAQLEKDKAKAEKAESALDVVLSRQPLCVKMSGKLARESKTNSPPTPGFAAASEAYPGLMFRIPANGAVSISAVGRSAPNQPTLIANFASNAKARPVANGWELTAAGPQSFALEVGDSRPVLQFGTIAKMPSDVGLLTSNGISTTFDANGVPTSVQWNVEPLPIAAILGLPAQIYGLRPLPAGGPNTTELLQTDALNRLLQSCIDAITAGVPVPAYCAGIVK